MHDPPHALSLQGPSNAAIQACMYKGRELVTYRAYLTLLCHAAVSQCQISISLPHSEPRRGGEGGSRPHPSGGEGRRGELGPSEKRVNSGRMALK